jgi:hypothetical protein
MIERMIPDSVTVSRNEARQFWKLLDLTTKEKESGLNVELFQDIEHYRCRGRMRPVIKCEMDGIACTTESDRRKQDAIEF